MYITQVIHKYSEKFELCIEKIELTPNSIIGLVGENGAGKTTLMSILAGYLKPSNECKLQYDNDNYNILYIPSDIEIYDFLTVKEFIRLIEKYSSTTLNQDEILDFIDLKDKSDCAIDQLSLGMKKKLTLIPLFLKKYDLIILDEPFNSIDLNYIYKLKKILHNLKSETTILISSHILETLVDLCDSFVVLSNGKVVNTFVNDGNMRSVEEEIFEGSNKI